MTYTIKSGAEVGHNGFLVCFGEKSIAKFNEESDAVAYVAGKNAGEHVLEQRISETAYNVKLADTGFKYVVTYGKQVENYRHTPEGLQRAAQEYIECVNHCIKLEKLS
jgi:hypothetical protein